MSLESDVRLLRLVPLFAEFTDDQLRLLAFSAETRRLGAGVRLFASGERGDAGFVVAAGTIEFEDGRGGRETCGPGTLIGELGLVVETQRLGTATAVEPSEVIQIRRNLFRRMLEEYPGVAEAIRTHIARRLATMNVELARVGALLEGGA